MRLERPASPPQTSLLRLDKGSNDFIIDQGISQDHKEKTECLSLGVFGGRGDGGTSGLVIGLKQSDILFKARGGT